jgi:hypothetical protein
MFLFGEKSRMEENVRGIIAVFVIREHRTIRAINEMLPRQYVVSY